MAKRLVLYGASNSSVLRVVEAVNRDSPTWGPVEFLDDTPGKGGEKFFGYPILGPRELISTMDLEHTWFFNNVFGSMPARRQVAEVLAGFNCNLTSLVWPTIDLFHAQVGIDVSIEQNATLDTGVTIGDHCTVKRNASVGHETSTGDFVFVGPGATICGRVQIGAGAYIGAGSVVRNDLVIGEDSTVGMGAVVVKDVPPGATVVGNPAKLLNR